MISRILLIHLRRTLQVGELIDFDRGVLPYWSLYYTQNLGVPAYGSGGLHAYVPIDLIWGGYNRLWGAHES